MSKEKTKEITKEPATGGARETAIEAFIEKKLKAFAERKTFEPLVEDADGKSRHVKWRWFINHFFFVERGHIEDSPEYMSLVRKRGAAETELVFANINLPDKWRVLSADTKTWGENWTEDVERSEAAVIRSMINYLFALEHIVVDDDDDDENQVEQCGRCGTAQLEEICQNAEGCDRHVCQATEAQRECCACVQDAALSEM